ncbi:BQ2448_6287 [Microbotryum intermedium]|uniref:BQ2448_6287 protein n=1 Tax=Microbotryum intermedium TaxID=269621 RepID=A0A238FKS5_9BASI|nr:BQ2448_6287 [Microbotryum intermedium]
MRPICAVLVVAFMASSAVAKAAYGLGDPKTDYVVSFEVGKNGDFNSTGAFCNAHRVTCIATNIRAKSHHSINCQALGNVNETQGELDWYWATRPSPILLARSAEDCGARTKRPKETEVELILHLLAAIRNCYGHDCEHIVCASPFTPFRMLDAPFTTTLSLRPFTYHSPAQATGRTTTGRRTVRVL